MKEYKNKYVKRLEDASDCDMNNILQKMLNDSFNTMSDVIHYYYHWNSLKEHPFFCSLLDSQNIKEIARNFIELFEEFRFFEALVATFMLRQLPAKIVKELSKEMGRDLFLLFDEYGFIYTSIPEKINDKNNS